MILSSYSIMGAYYNVRDKATGENYRGVEWVNDKTGEILIIKRDTEGEVELDEHGRCVRMTIYKDIELVRHTTYPAIVVDIIKRIIEDTPRTLKKLFTKPPKGK